MTRKALLSCLLVFVLMSIGCTESTVRRPGQTISLQQVAYDSAFDASLDAVRELFPIEMRDRQAGQILSRPVAYSGDEPSAGISTGLTSSTVELRRRANVNLAEHDDGCSVDVRVDIERRDTQEYQMYEGIMAAEDLRMRTPAERRDMATQEQRDVWTFIRRDRTAEEQIIRNIHQRLGLITPSQ
jgi:hypothetical protein